MTAAIESIISSDMAHGEQARDYEKELQEHAQACVRNESMAGDALRDAEYDLYRFKPDMLRNPALVVFNPPPFISDDLIDNVIKTKLAHLKAEKAASTALLNDESRDRELVANTYGSPVDLDREKNIAFYEACLREINSLGSKVPTTHLDELMEAMHRSAMEKAEMIGRLDVNPLGRFLSYLAPSKSRERSAFKKNATAASIIIKNRALRVMEYYDEYIRYREPETENGEQQ